MKVAPFAMDDQDWYGLLTAATCAAIVILIPYMTHDSYQCCLHNGQNDVAASTHPRVTVATDV
jgi:hypothetical protein